MTDAGKDQSTAEFDDFLASGEVEVGKPAETEATEDPKPEPDPKPAEAADEGDENPDDSGEEDDGDEQPKQKRKPSERIRELTRKVRERDRQIETLMQAVEKIAGKDLSQQNSGGNQVSETSAPDPTDTDKYPLGHLDDRYIEDKLEWLAEKKAADRADAVLQRQQEQAQQQELLTKVDTLATRGSEIFDDFQEAVVEAGMKGEWSLDQPTFEAAFEADNGAQILYELSQDPKEAKRVASLSPFQQLKFVQARDAEISAGKQPRKVPKAGDPPQNLPRGTNSRTQINPATDDLDDFERAWNADAKKR